MKGRYANWARKWVYPFVVISVVVIGGLLLLPLPSPLFPNDYSFTLLDRSGQLLQAKVSKDEQWRIPLPDHLPDRLSTCQILYEDEYFYRHPGVNPVSLLRAFRQNIKRGRIVSGGSTLSMQVVRLALGPHKRTYLQKAWEVLLTLKLELLYSKDDILKAYLQHAPYGGNIVGASAASWRYYGREIDDLSWGEAATLAVLPNHPGQVFPGRGQEKLLSKRNALIAKLHDRGYLSNEEAHLSLAEKLPSYWRDIPQLAPHLAQKLQLEGSNAVRSQTSLSIQAQRKVQEIINEHVRIREAEEVHNAAAIVINNRDRSVVAYVGNADPAEEGKNRYVDMLGAMRSPGSLLKPYLYAHCLDQGLILPQQWLPDYPIYHQGFAPQNYDQTFRGAVPADRALASSLNVPFVHLLKEYGYERFHQDLLRAGITLPNPPGHYGMSLILGGFETSPLEIAGMYSGLYHAYRNFGSRGRNFLFEEDLLPVSFLPEEENKTKAGVPMDWLSVHGTHHMLMAMTKVRKPEDLAYWNERDIPVTIAWKTGTSYGLRDAWAVGISDEYTVAVWVGNASGEGRSGLVGSRVAAPILFDILERLDAKSIVSQSLGFPQALCKISGMKISPLCKDTVFINIPGHWYNAPLCQYHEKVLINKETGLRIHRGCPSSSKAQEEIFTSLPPAMAKYYKGQSMGEGLPDWAPDCPSIGREANDLVLLYPVNGSRIRQGQAQEGNTPGLVMHAVHSSDEAKVFWYLNDSLVTMTINEHKISVSLPHGEHRITLVDDQGTRLQSAFSVIE